MEEKNIEFIQDNTSETKTVKPVTRKFIIIALAVTLLLNAALSAGMMALFARKSMGGRPGMPGGRPDSGFFQDGDQNNGNFAPPGGSQNPGNGN